MEEQLIALLVNVAGGRRYWGRAPQSEPLPFVVMNRIDGARNYTTRGPSGFVQSRVQLDCYAETYTEAKGVARAVRDDLSGVTSGEIQGIFIDAERDLPAADAGEATHLYRVSIDILVNHGE